MYAIMCYEIGKQGERKKYVGGMVALFKKYERAVDCCQFLNNGAMPGFAYEIHNIITDL